MCGASELVGLITNCSWRHASCLAVHFVCSVNLLN